MLEYFGFDSFNKLGESLFKFQNFLTISIFSFVGSVFSRLLGLEEFIIGAFLVLIVAELGFGLWTGYRKAEKFSLKKLERFGLKLLVYSLILLIFTALKNQYADATPEYHVYNSIHSFVTFYIAIVYLISIMSNVNFIIGGSDDISNLIKIFKLKLNKKTKELNDSD